MGEETDSEYRSRVYLHPAPHRRFRRLLCMHHEKIERNLTTTKHTNLVVETEKERNDVLRPFILLTLISSRSHRDTPPIPATYCTSRFLRRRTITPALRGGRFGSVLDVDTDRALEKQATLDRT